MRRLRARSVLGASLLLGAFALSCGGGDTENLFTHPSTVAGNGAGGAEEAGAHNVAGAGHAGAGHPPSGGASGNGASGAPSGGAGEEAGAPAAGSSGTAGAGNAAGASGSAGGGGTAAGAAGGGASGMAGTAGNGGNAGAGGSTCVDNSSCKDTEYCAKVSCLAKAEGHCTPSPTDCSNEKLGVVCGCDGITYHDACLLHQNRQNSSAVDAGACAKVAEGTMSCSTIDSAACTERGGVCGYQVENACAISTPNAKGICWILPASCPGSDDHTAELCSAVQDTSCTSECAAIKSGQRYALSEICK